MKASGKMAGEKEMELFSLKTEENMKENGKMMRWTAMGHILSEMATSTKACF
jgi:hypothetical protein